MNPPVTQIIASHLLFLFVRAKTFAANQRPGFLQKKNPLSRAEKKSTHLIKLTTPNEEMLQFFFTEDNPLAVIICKDETSSNNNR
jgi:hypothetical protein